MAVKGYDSAAIAEALPKNPLPFMGMMQTLQGRTVGQSVFTARHVEYASREVRAMPSPKLARSSQNVLQHRPEGRKAHAHEFKGTRVSHAERGDGP